VSYHLVPGILSCLTSIADSIGLIDYIFTIARGSTTPPQDHGVVAVIDGKLIKVTPFQMANVPPPMALHEFSVHANAIDIAINWDASLFAVLHQQGISIFEWKSVAATGSVPALIGRLTFDKDQNPNHTYQQISFSENDEILVLQRVRQASIVKRYGFDDETGRMEEKSSGNSLGSALSTLSSFSIGGSSNAFTQGLSGDLHNLVFGGQSLAHCKLPTQLPWVEIVSYGDDCIAFGMSNNGHLYANSRLLVKNCTSFLATPSHLIFTTTTHLLKFVHITSAQGMSDLSQAYFGQF
jgi:elongator complex protein 1